MLNYKNFSSLHTNVKQNKHDFIKNIPLYQREKQLKGSSSLASVLYYAIYFVGNVT